MSQSEQVNVLIHIVMQFFFFLYPLHCTRPHYWSAAFHSNHSNGFSFRSSSHMQPCKAVFTHDVQRATCHASYRHAFRSNCQQYNKQHTYSRRQLSPDIDSSQCTVNALRVCSVVSCHHRRHNKTMSN